MIYFAQLPNGAGDDLAERINAEHTACVGAMQSALDHAIAAGKLLIEVKASLGHGEFLPWIKQHCAFSERMAQRYMKAAKWRELNPTRTTDLSLMDVLAELAAPKPSAATSGLERHEFNTILPSMTPEEFAGLRESIARLGLLTAPITLYEGLILDGWHRYRACIEAGVEPEFREFDGTPEDALGLVWSLNMQRKQLTPDELAVYLVKAMALVTDPGE